MANLQSTVTVCIRFRKLQFLMGESLLRVDSRHKALSGVNDRFRSESETELGLHSGCGYDCFRPGAALLQNHKTPPERGFGLCC